MDRFAALEGLFDEVRLGMHRLVQVTEALHADEPVTLGQRAVLEYLARHGDAAVPRIARDRHVSRQHIQTLVNPLLALALVEAKQNPAHRRSSLIGLTASGATLIRALRREERRAFEAMGIGVNVEELLAAAAVLRRVRAALFDVGRPLDREQERRSR